MASGIFADRERALENEFFRRVDHDLLAKLRNQMDRKSHIEALASVTQIDDQSVLAELVDHDFSPALLVSLSLAPVICVAWADGRLDRQERDQVLEAARQFGCPPDSVAGKVLAKWLRDGPEADLLPMWKHYTTALLKTLSMFSRHLLANRIITVAEQTASAAGGVLGLSRVSKDERQVLDEIRSVFEPFQQTPEER